MIGDLLGFGIVWYHPTGIANVLSLSKVQDRYRVTCDSDGRNYFRVYSPNAPNFIMSPGGLYYHDMSKAGDSSHVLAEQGVEIDNENEEEDLAEQDAEDSPSGEPVGIKTVNKLKSGYTDHEINRANRACRFQEILGASLRTILHIVDRKLFPNCPITRTDIKMAEHIYGPSRAHLKGKTVCRSTDHVVNNVSILQTTIMAKYMTVTLCADIIFINGVRFFTTVSRHTKFITGLHIADATTETLESSLQSVKAIYANARLQDFES